MPGVPTLRVGDQRLSSDMPPSEVQREIKKRRPCEAIEVDTYLNLHPSHAVLAGQFDDLFKRHGTSEPQYNVLRILRGARGDGDEALPCLEIAERMITRVPDITRL